ncbi:transcriptional regulator [Methanothermobacter sp. CaT2]|uniref:ArsR/SmtB family transcription factor n=1 Tax=Methanothermobacter sp. CaT2 TaxID=866790 RepID=UPI0002CCE7A8|nr:metalloregulator ArsR/SmtB family transcription factor [Methanothermobacter sp. CaT2]BAM70065.1 transcriptional regulator [Methanothermobacter sp. CaT2]
MRELKKKISRLPPQDEIKREAEVLKALADPTRLLIIHLLSEGDLCVCEIMAALKRPQPTVSHHLNILKRAGFLKAEKRGVWVHYSLASDELPSIIEQLINKRVTP